jgi:hypothetical protein
VGAMGWSQFWASGWLAKEAMVGARGWSQFWASGWLAKAAMVGTRGWSQFWATGQATSLRASSTAPGASSE